MRSMRSHFLVLLFAAIVILSAALSTAVDPIEASLNQQTTPDFGIASNNYPIEKRLLRVEPTDVADEENRAFTWITKLTNWFTKDPAKLEQIAKNKRHRQWLKEGEDPTTIWAKLGLTGQGPAWKLKDDPRFHEYLEFSALWRRKKGALAKEWWQFWRKNAW